jgi:hypothetical protein
MAFRRVCLLAAPPGASAAEGQADAEAVAALLAENGLVAVPPEEADTADGFLALPGGVGSLEALFERWGGAAGLAATVPCALLNTGDYFTRLLRSAGDATMERFVRETQRGALIVDRDPSVLLRALADFRPPETRRHFA